MLNERPINQTQHQQSFDWLYRELASDLHLWAERFNLRFKLTIPLPALRIDRIRPRKGGHDCIPNGFGLQHEIAIKNCYLDRDRYGEVLGILLHALLHLWQHAHGRPSRSRKPLHNVEFRAKCRNLGLIIDDLGQNWYAETESPFLDLLRENGVHAPEMKTQSELEIIQLRGTSKFKKWICSCKPPICCRIDRRDFRARCVDCGGLFRPDVFGPSSPKVIHGV